MNKNTIGMIGTIILNGAIWATGGIVAATAIKKTGNGKWGWLMLIPAVSCFSYEGNNSTTTDQN